MTDKDLDLISKERKNHLAGKDAAALKVDYFQIDTIRFITICFIVWGHSLFSQWGEELSSDFRFENLRVITIQLGKISTPIFFVVAGFLLRPRLKYYNFKNYFIDRGPKVYFPWVFFIVFFFFLQFFQLNNWRDIFIEHDLKKLTYIGYKIFNGLMLYTAYWIITTYLVSMTIFIIFKEQAEKWWFGLLFGAIFLFYAVNLYYQWLPANHAKAILGYAFFVWLGIILHKHFNVFSLYLNKLPWIVIIVSLIGFFILSCYEGIYLSKIGSADSFSSNRISNSIFSMVFFIAMMKFGPILIINKLNPRKITFGIFLFHNLIIFQLSIWSSQLNLKYVFPNALLLFLSQIVYCGFIVFCSCMIVRWLMHSKLSWLIGLKRVKKSFLS